MTIKEALQNDLVTRYYDLETDTFARDRFRLVLNKKNNILMPTPENYTIEETEALVTLKEKVNAKPDFYK
ncbi:MAG: hypothetical protein HYT08_00530 [Candidatus Levybacteria bacterium]|nr:hypothetical protein [Candidatus Levybacteria bacterium]